MNSKLRKALNKYAQDYYLLLRTGAHQEIAESKLAEAEKAIRQAVGEEMLRLALPYCLTKAAERDLRQKIEHWRMS